MHPRTYWTYLLSNAGRIVLYIGVTNNLARRLAEHRSQAGDGFAARYCATDLMRFEAFAGIDDAIAREKQIKRWHREWKWNLVKSDTPELRDLTPELIHLR